MIEADPLDGKVAVRGRPAAAGAAAAAVVGGEAATAAAEGWTVDGVVGGGGGGELHGDGRRRNPRRPLCRRRAPWADGAAWSRAGARAARGEHALVFGNGRVGRLPVQGPSPADVAQRGALRDAAAAAALLGYQCRWNYKDEEDDEVLGGFESTRSFDVLWLDIEHRRQRYFTWDETKFPTPARMQRELAATGASGDDHRPAPPRPMTASSCSPRRRTPASSTHRRQLVAYEGAAGRALGLARLPAAGGARVLGAAVRRRRVGGSTGTCTWNDMNEPSV